MSKRKIKQARQYAAIPIGTDAAGCPRILLVTSRGSRRWIIPQGWPIAGLTGSRVALREAWEEAGAVGHIVGDRPLGEFHYRKQLAGGTIVPCRAEAWLMQVSHLDEDWPERAERQRAWFTPAAASLLVAEPELRAMLASLGTRTTVAEKGPDALSLPA